MFDHRNIAKAASLIHALGELDALSSSFKRREPVVIFVTTVTENANCSFTITTNNQIYDEMETQTNHKINSITEELIAMGVDIMGELNSVEPSDYDDIDVVFADMLSGQ
jgi:hypothetical protein